MQLDAPHTTIYIHEAFLQQIHISDVINERKASDNIDMMNKASIKPLLDVSKFLHGWL